MFHGNKDSIEEDKHNDHPVENLALHCVSNVEAEIEYQMIRIQIFCIESNLLGPHIHIYNHSSPVYKSITMLTDTLWCIVYMPLHIQIVAVHS